MWNDIGLSLPWFSFQTIRHGWKIDLQLDTSGIVGNGEQESLNGNNHDLGCPWFGRIVSVDGRQLLDYWVCGRQLLD